MRLVLMLEEALRTVNSSQKGRRWVDRRGCILRPQNCHNQRSQLHKGTGTILQDLGITGSPGLGDKQPHTQSRK
jgi:hypothetical protein